MMVQKHSDYYGLLEQLQEPSCALCRIALRAASRYFDALLYESVNDFGVRETLKASHGFCPTHSATLAERHDSLGTSIIYRSILNTLDRELASLDPQGQKTLLGRMRDQLGMADGAGTPLAPEQSCPACAQRDQAISRALSLMAKHSDDAALRDAIRHSDGFCLPHLRAALPALHGSVRQELIARQRQLWQSLVAELSEAIRKHDARFRDEPWGPEEDAWRRAIEATSGLHGVF